MTSILTGRVLIWAGIGVAMLIFPRRLLQYHHSPTFPYSFWCAFYAALKSFPIAFLFCPTCFLTGWFGLPAPATFVILCCLVDSEFRRNNNELIRKNLGLAMILFSSFWFCAWLFTFIRHSRKLHGEASVHTETPMKQLAAMLGIASLLLAGIIYYFGFCYAQPPRGVSVYSGP